MWFLGCIVAPWLTKISAVPSATEAAGFQHLGTRASSFLPARAVVNSCDPKKVTAAYSALTGRDVHLNTLYKRLPVAYERVTHSSEITDA